MSHKQLALVFLILACPAALTGCGGRRAPTLVNECSFSVEGLSDVTISYGCEDISFLPSDGDMLVVREYMTADQRRYYAKVEQGRGRVHISEGGHPLGRGGFQRYVEVLLPAAYGGDLTITSTSGRIDLSALSPILRRLRIDDTSGTVVVGDVTADSLFLSSTSGTLELGRLRAENIRLETTSGQVACEALVGVVDYVTTRGDLSVRSASGHGSYRAEQEGCMVVAYTAVDGDLTLFDKNGDIELSLPEGLAFVFEGGSRDGALETDLQVRLALDGDVWRGSIGEDPAVTVAVETRDGDISVKLE